MRHLFHYAVALIALGCSATLPGQTCAPAQFTALAARVTIAAPAGPGVLKTPLGETIENLPAFCRVTGILEPTADSRIRFEVWLPKEGWNGRLLGVGNGGYAGTINYDQMAKSLRLGYATFSTDTGHQAGAEDATWAYRHPEKITDFAGRALHLTTLAAKQAVSAYYGKPQQHAYFDACSTGGRQGLMEAQRFPEDFDGILAGAPANNWTHMLTSGIDVFQTMIADPAGYLPGFKLPALHRAVLAACDQLDGVADGILNNPTQCHFDPKALLCTGDDTLDCLTAPQVRSVRKLYAGGSTRAGEVLFPGLARGSEEPGWDYWITGAGPGAGASARYPVEFFRYMVMTDPDWDPLRANVAEALHRAEQGVGHEIDATDPNLKPFFTRGGKLLLYHGWNDAAISPWNTIHYYEEVRRTVGAAAQHSVRLYMVPGMEHCSGGPGPDRFGQLGLSGAPSGSANALTALETWVEQGHDPGTLLAVKLDSRRSSAQPAMARPLCPYPEIAQYNGTGDPKQPQSFTCKAK